MEAGPERFPLYGREEILNRLEQRLEALKKGYRQNVSLVGPPFIGKTSILRRFLERVRQEPDILPIYCPLAPCDFEGFLERWVGSLLQGYLASRGISFPEEFQQIVRLCRPHIPKTLERMREAKKHAFQKKTPLAFRELLSLTATLREETGKKILLMPDEFQFLGDLELADPFGLFGREMMIQKDTWYVAASSTPERTREIFNDRLALLFGNFEVIELGPISRTAVRQWAAESCAERLIPEEDFRLLHHFLGDHPYYLELFWEAVGLVCRGDSASRPYSWSRDLLMQILTGLLFEDRGSLNRHFETTLQNLLRIGRQTRPYVKTLLAVANGRSKIHPIAAYIGKKGTEAQKLLQRLVGEGMVDRQGAFYRLGDSLFRFWLRHVYQLKERDLSPDRESARAIFRGRLSEEVRKIEEEDRTDLTVRIESLFREFRNEVTEINQKKFRCSTFLELASRPTNGRYFPIQGRSLHGRWFCQVFREAVAEADVAGFLDELKSGRRKFQRRLMLALGGIDLNAKLMAQEAGIQIWDLENLNGLLDLYGKLKVLI